MLGRFGDDLPDEFQSEALATVAIHLTVREGHPLADLDRSVGVQDVRPFSWIMPPPADPTAVHLEQVFREVFHSAPPAAVEAVSQNVIVALLQASDMITAMPGITVNPPPSGLHRLNADWLSWTRSAGVISVREQTPLPSCARFLDLLRKEMAHRD